MKINFALAAIPLAIAQPLLAQALTPAAPPIVVAQAPQQPLASLPVNTLVTLAMNSDLTTKGGRLEVGHKFNLSLTHDVRLSDFIVIPRGTPAVGEVTWLTGKGAFGKSGKMEIALRYLDLNGRRIPINGTYRQEGEGNTVATVGTVVLAGVFAAFVTGKSARIPQGRELQAHTTEALPVQLPLMATAPAASPVQASVAAPAIPIAPAVATTPPPAATTISAPGT